jgi:hypothetical protein
MGSKYCCLFQKMALPKGEFCGIINEEHRYHESLLLLLVILLGLSREVAICYDIQRGVTKRILQFARPHNLKLLSSFPKR